MGYCSFHCTLCYALYQKHRPVSDAAGTVCSIYGMLLIYSATLNPVTALDGSTKNLYVQGAAIILGLAAFVALSLIDLENLGDLWKIFVIGNILLQFLLFTPLGTEVNGQRAWLNLGVTSLQPGELGKLIFIFTIAAHMTEIQDHITEWRGLVSVGLHTLVMMGAVVLSSGDTGMAIQYLMIAVIMLFSAGRRSSGWALLPGVGIASVPILWNYVLKDYQKTRILVLLTRPLTWNSPDRRPTARSPSARGSLPVKAGPTAR